MAEAYYRHAEKEYGARTLSRDELRKMLKDVPMSAHEIKTFNDSQSAYHLDQIVGLLERVPFHEQGQAHFRERLTEAFQNSFFVDGSEAGSTSAAALTRDVTQEIFNTRRVTGSGNKSVGGDISDIISAKKHPAGEGCVVRYHQSLSYYDAYLHAMTNYTATYLRDFVDDGAIYRGSTLDDPWWHELYMACRELPADKTQGWFLRYRVDYAKARKYGFYLEDIATKVLRENVDAVMERIKISAKVAIIISPPNEAVLDLFVEAITLTGVLSNYDDDPHLAELYVLEHLRQTFVLARTSPKSRPGPGKLVSGIHGISQVETVRVPIVNTLERIAEEPRTDLFHPLDMNPRSYQNYLVISLEERPDKEFKYTYTTRKLSYYVSRNLSFTNDTILRPEGRLGTQRGDVKPIRAWKIKLNEREHHMQGVSMMDVLRALASYDKQILCLAYDSETTLTKCFNVLTIIKNNKRYLLAKKRGVPNSRIIEYVIYTNKDPRTSWSEATSQEHEITDPKKTDPLFIITHRTYGNVVYPLLTFENVDGTRLIPTNINTAFNVGGIEMALAVGYLTIIGTFSGNPSSALLVLSRMMREGYITPTDITAAAATSMGPLSRNFIGGTYAAIASSAVQESVEVVTSATANLCVGAIRENHLVGNYGARDIFGRPIIDGLPFEIPDLQADPQLNNFSGISRLVAGIMAQDEQRTYVDFTELAGLRYKSIHSTTTKSRLQSVIWKNLAGG